MENGLGIDRLELKNKTPVSRREEKTLLSTYGIEIELAEGR